MKAGPSVAGLTNMLMEMRRHPERANSAKRWEQIEREVWGIAIALKTYPLVPATLRPESCFDHAGRITEFGKGYNAGYLLRAAENMTLAGTMRGKD